MKKISDDIAKYKIAEKTLIVAASKTVSPQVIDEAFDAGITDFGENRVQELVEKQPRVKRAVRWHFIGRLQTNKVKYIIDKVVMIHSVDSEKLLVEIDKQAQKNNLIMPVLAQVNMAKEQSKGGVMPGEIVQFCEKFSRYANVSLKGIMCVFPKGAEKSLYEEAQSLSATIKQLYGAGELSMGMSEDYVDALTHGATIIRPGRAIFGERERG